MRTHYSFIESSIFGSEHKFRSNYAVHVHTIFETPLMCIYKYAHNEL